MKDYDTVGYKVVMEAGTDDTDDFATPEDKALTAAASAAADGKRRDKPPEKAIKIKRFSDS